MEPINLVVQGWPIRILDFKLVESTDVVGEFEIQSDWCFDVDTKSAAAERILEMDPEQIGKAKEVVHEMVKDFLIKLCSNQLDGNYGTK